MVKIKLLLLCTICFIIFACQTNTLNLTSVVPIAQNTNTTNLVVKDTIPTSKKLNICMINSLTKQMSVRSKFSTDKLGVFLKKQLKSDVQIQKPESIAIEQILVFDKQYLDSSYVKSFTVSFSNKKQYHIIFESDYITQYVLSGKNTIDTLWKGTTLPDLMWNSAEAWIVSTSLQSYLAVMGTFYNATGLGVDDKQCVFWDLKTGNCYKNNSFLGVPECFNDYDQNGKLNFLSLQILYPDQTNGKIYYSAKMYELNDSVLTVINSPFDKLFLSRTEAYNFSFVKKIPKM